MEELPQLCPWFDGPVPVKAGMQEPGMELGMHDLGRIVTKGGGGGGGGVVLHLLT